MAGNDLMMNLRLQLAEKVSGPLKEMAQASQINTKALRANRDQLRALERQSGLIQRLKQQQEAFRRASNEMRVNQANLDALKLSGSATAAQIKAQTALVDKSTLAFTRQKDRLFELRSAATAAGIGRLSDDERRLAGEITRTTQQIQQQEGALKRLDQLREQRNRALAVTAGIGAVGLGMRMAGNKGLNTSRNLIASGFAFDSEMANLQGKFNLASGSAELLELRDLIQSFDRKDSAQLAVAVQQFAQAGFTLKQSMAGVPTLIHAADAAHMSLSDTAVSFSGVMKGFNRSYDEFAAISDKIFGASQASGIAVDKFNDALASIGPTARATGFSLEHTAAFLGLLNRAGIDASDSASGLKTMLERLQKPNEQALRRIGIDPSKVNSMPELIGLIEQQTAGMSDLRQLEVYSEIFGKGQAVLAQQLFRQMRGGGMDEMLGTINNSGGATARLAEQNSNHLQNATDDLKASLGGLKQVFFDANESWLRPLVQQLTEVISGFRAWLKENPALAKALGIVFIAGSALLATVGTLMTALAGILVPIITLKYMFAMLGVKGLTLGSAVLKLGGAFKALGATIFATPIGWLVIALSGLAFAIYKNWDAIVWFFKDTWDNIKTFFSSGIGNITATILNWSPLGLFHKAFAAVLSWFGIDLPADFGAAAVGMITSFGEGLLSMGGWLLDTVAGLFNGVFDWFTDMPARFMEMGGLVIDGLVDGIKGAAGAVKDAVVNTANSVVGWFKGILRIESPSKVFMAAGLNISEGAAIGITNGLPRVKRATEALGNEARPRFTADTRSPIGSIAAAAAARAPVTYGGDQITINIIGTGLNAQEVAQAVDAKLRQRDQAKAASRRSSYYD